MKTILEKNNIELKQALVTAVVPASKHIVLLDETLSYDKLVIGIIGSKPNLVGQDKIYKE
jgi:NADH dehydrogenase FAD-containing subunit